MAIERILSIQGPAPLASIIISAASGSVPGLARALEETDAETIVVVDGNPETARALRGMSHPRLVLVESAVALGEARERNRALELARGEIVIHVAAEDELVPGAIAAILEAFRGKPHVGAVYGDLELEGVVRREPAFPGRRAFLEAPFDVPLLAHRRSLGGFDEGAVRCENAGVVARVSRTHAVAKLDRALVRHRPTREAHAPIDCATCPSSTSCRLANARRTRRDAHSLRKLSLVLTTRCNLDCSYCYTRRYKWDLDTSEALRLLVQARDHGAEVVSFTGGEPSLHEGFDTILASAADLGFSILVISNGWKWPEERLAHFTSLPRARLILSLEGRTAAKHDAIRGPGSHATLMGFFQRVRERAPSFPISAIVVATPDNLGELEDIAAWAFSDLRLDGLRLDRVAPTGNAEANEEWSPEATRRFLEVGRAVAARWPGRVEAMTESFPAEGCPLYVNLVEDTFPDLQVFADGTVPMCVYLHLDRPTRLGTVSHDLEELLARGNTARAKGLIDAAFADRPRQLERKGLFTCVECLERRAVLERKGAWPPRARSLPVIEASPRFVGRPRTAAERSGRGPRPVVLG